MIGAGPPVASETTSLSEPGSLPWTAEKPPPTRPILAPPLLVRDWRAHDCQPGRGAADTGYGTGSGAGAAGVVLRARR